MTTQMNLTGFRSLTYRSAYVYNWLLKRLHDQKSKFTSIARICGKNHSIMDIPCGTGYLARFLHSTNKYYGWDLNFRFLKKILKDWKKGKISLKKIVIKQKDIFDFEDYPRDDIDIVVFCDILHHVYGKHKELVEHAKEFADKIIICEPIAVNPQNIEAYDNFFKIMIKIGKYFPEKLFKLFDFFLFDNDGINPYDQREQWIHDDESLINLYDQLGIEDRKIFKINDSYLGIWEA
jgi:SAM-dependent methyltransferase